MRYTRAIVGVISCLAVIALPACSAVSEDGSQTEDFPSESIRLLVPYSAGGPTDTMARSVGEAMGRELDTEIVVEAMPGASGSRAYQELASAEPDGYTLSMVALPTTTLNYLTQDVEYDADSFTPVGVVSEVPSGILVPADSPHESIEDLTKSSGEIEIGTPGATSGITAELERWIDIYDSPITPVPYDGGAKVRTALLGSNVTAGMVSLTPEFLSLVDANKVNLLAVGSKERMQGIDAPTLAQSGFPKLTGSTFTYGIATNAGVPDAVVEKLASALKAALRDEDVQETIGARYIPDSFRGGSDLSKVFSKTETTFQGVELG